MTTKESTLISLMQNLGYSEGAIVVSMQLLSQSVQAQEDAIIYLYEENASENDFISYIMDII